MEKFENLSFRVRNGLLNAGCPHKTRDTVKRWVNDYGPNNLMKLKNFGRSSFVELFTWLDENEEPVDINENATREEEIRYHRERIKYHTRMAEIHRMWFTHAEGKE